MIRKKLDPAQRDSLRSPHLPSANAAPLRVRHVATAASLLIATLVPSSGAVTFAQTAPPGEPTLVQRPISEDPLVDQNLVASLPPLDADAGGQQMAAVDPGT